MNKLSLMVAAAVVATSTPAAAASYDWKDVVLDGDANGKWAYDVSSYTAEGPIARFLARHETNTGAWELMTVEVDCGHTMYRNAHVYRYQGRTFLGADHRASRWMYIPANTIAAYFITEVCE